MATIAAGGQRFEMGRVVSRTFGTIGRQAALLAAIVIVLYIVPTILTQALLQHDLAALRTGAGNPFAAFTSPLFWGRSLLGVVIFFFMQAAVTHVALADLDGRQPSPAATFKTALAVALPLFALGILYFLACEIGLMLLIVPGVIMFLMWSVAGVVLVAERKGVFASFGRSRLLTKGYRWSIFGLAVVLVVFYILFTLLIAFSGGVGGQLLGGARPTEIATPGIGAILLQAIGGGILTLIATVGFTAIYAELRAVKEGATGESLAAIFA